LGSCCSDCLRAVEHDEVAALGELRVDEVAGAFERGAAVAIAPVRGEIVLLRLGIERRRDFVPARIEALCRERSVERFE